MGVRVRVRVRASEGVGVCMRVCVWGRSLLFLPLVLSNNVVCMCVYVCAPSNSVQLPGDVCGYGG